MKTLHTNYVLKGLAVMLISFVLFSCEKDDINFPEEPNNEQVLQKTDERPDQGSYCVNYDRGCADDLIDDGCNFTSGNGRDMPNQYLMVDMLNDCRRETLPNNCSWVGNTTVTTTIEVDLNNCCYPFYALNSRLDSWKAQAQAAKPNSSYLITNYQRIGGYMVTSYGPYRMKIRVTYRKKICALTPIRYIKK
ncbi:hypothetical protein [Aquimarina brevivitae]|uniref:Lipoprotein n=1 Tax=Aquimarina brevivitae TaxID=323412 RepID=A0A4V2F5Q4_9FLAO|nr:hypothetical protein [Aquimarina brevivitae]RZS93629.1 hypothetical protein EV197_2209 [Aquimarina brevivitae]